RCPKPSPTVFLKSKSAAGLGLRAKRAVMYPVLSVPPSRVISMSNLVLSTCPEEGTAHRETDVVEVPLLLPTWQMSALEGAAHARGVTAASMVRHLLNDFISNLAPSHRSNGAAREVSHRRRRNDTTD